MKEARLKEGIQILHEEIRNLQHTRFIENKNFIQHGTTTLYQHCISVAYRSIVLAVWFHWKVDMRSMIRGALLHDYYLYDWHDKVARCKLHGFRHPRLACTNATRDFRLNPLEQEIIRRHMFPLTPIPPMHKEGWIITIADKLCGLQETFNLRTTFWKPIPFF